MLLLEAAPHNNARLCARCTSIDLCEALDPRKFENLPPLQSAGAASWTDYVRKIMTFTMDSVRFGRRSCELCSLLCVVASVVEDYRVPTARTQKTTPMEDGEGFTLAATSSHFLHPTALSNRTHAGATCCTEDSAAWLLVLKGSNTLERIAHEYDKGIPKGVMTCLSHFLGDTGTMIAEVSTDDVSNTLAPIRDRLVRISGGVDYAPIRSWLSSCIADHRSCVSPTDKQAISPYEAH